MSRRARRHRDRDDHGFASLLLTVITLVVTRLGNNIDKVSDRLDAGQRDFGDRLEATPSGTSPLASTPPSGTSPPASTVA